MSSDRAKLDATEKRNAFSANRRASRSRLTLLPSGFTARPLGSIAAGELAPYLPLEFGAKIDVLGSIAGGVRVGDVGGDQLLPGAEKTHVLFKISGYSLKHDRRRGATVMPTDKPLSWKEGRGYSRRKSDDNRRISDGLGAGAGIDGESLMPVNGGIGSSRRPARDDPDCANRREHRRFAGRVG